MRRLIQYWQPLPIEIVGGMVRQAYSEQKTAFLSMQPVDGGSSFKTYLASRKPQDHMEAIGEADLAVTEEGERIVLANIMRWYNVRNGRTASLATTNICYLA